MLDRGFKRMGIGEAGRRRLLHYYGEFRGSFLLGAFCLVVTNGLLLTIPWIIKLMIDDLKPGAVDTSRLGHLAALIAGLALVGASTRIASRILIFHSGRQIEYELRNALFLRYLRYPMKTFAARRVGDLMSRAANDLGSVRMLFGFGLLHIINTPLNFLLTLVFMWSINAKLTLLSVLLFPLFIQSVRRYSRRMVDLTLKVQEHLGRISNVAQENFNGIQVVKSFTLEDDELDRFRKVCENYRGDSVRLAVVRGIIFNTMQTVGRFSIGLVLLYGGILIIRGEITRGDFVAFNAWLGMMVFPLLIIGYIMTLWQRGIAALERIEEVLAEPEEPETTIPAPPGIDLGPALFTREIEFRGLTFHYPALPHTDPGSPSISSRPALNEITFRIEPGEWLAVVGPTGCGKSTLGVALTRLFEVPAGRIFIGGVDVDAIPLTRLRRWVGFVTQNHFLFSDSLGANLAFGRPDVEEEGIRAAGLWADLDKDAQEWPRGYRTFVGERGLTLSGGQRQRATLARALLYNPEILFLDDPFSNVDLKTEETILANLRDRLAGKTVVLATHRIATAARADRILVMAEGRLIDEGRHEALMVRCPLYSRMARLQALEAEMEAVAS